MGFYICFIHRNTFSTSMKTSFALDSMINYFQML